MKRNAALLALLVAGTAHAQQNGAVFCAQSAAFARHVAESVRAGDPQENIVNLINSAPGTAPALREAELRVVRVIYAAGGAADPEETALSVGAGCMDTYNKRLANQRAAQQ